MTTDGKHPTTRSDELRKRALEVLPGGVNSNIRLLAPPTFFEHASGSRMVDVDGNDYIDYLLGQGPNFLGHGDRTVLNAVAEACENGMVYGAQHRYEVEAAESIIGALGWPDQVRIGLSGTECVQAALRLARAVTGREKFVRFAGHYHGWLDNVLVAVEDGRAVPATAGQVGSHLDESIMLPWNDLSAVEELLDSRGDEIAAVIMEPVMLNTGSIEPRSGYLEGVRAACNRHDVVLIFDEVISGFRVALGGAVERYGVAPDLATYGKAVAGGWPVAVLAGRRNMMERFGTGEVNHSGTFNASVMASAAVIASIERLSRTPPYEQVESVGSLLMHGISDLGADHNLNLNVQGLPMAFHVGLGSGPIDSFEGMAGLDAAGYGRFTRVLASHGVWVAGRGIWFVSVAHDERDVADTLERVGAAMEEFASE